MSFFYPRFIHFIWQSGHFSKVYGIWNRIRNFWPRFTPNWKIWKISFTTALNTFCKPLPMFRVDNNAPLHSVCLSLMQSRIFYPDSILFTFGRDWLTPQISSNISVDIGSSSDSLPESITSISSSIIYSGIIESSSDSLPLSASSQVSDNKFPTMPKAVTNLLTIQLCHHLLANKKLMRWIKAMSLKMNLCLRRC